jgi:predicted lactoylglutathione lyase
MAKKIFVNMAVRDVNKSKEFFSKLGYTFNDQFSNDTSFCMVISDDIYAMMMTHEKFGMFSPKEVCDTSKSQEVLICLTQESRAAVDDSVAKALSAGGTLAQKEPMDMGFMYGNSFYDLDGHAWENFWMDPAHVQK